MKSILPSGPEVLREAVVLIGGAILAAVILSQIPALRDYINRNTKGCDCGNT